jgi:MFS family permease
MLLPIFLIVLVDILAFTLVIPLLAIYAEHLGATPLVATLLVSVFAVCQLFSGPLIGRISDRVGRKPMLVISQVGTLLGLLVMGSANTLWLLFVGRILDGATAGNLSLAQAYIADNTKPEDRARSFAIIGIAFGLGFFLGPSMAGYLSQYGLHVPFHVAAGLSLLSIVCTAVLLPNQQPVARPAGADIGPGGQRLALTDWATYAQYFERPVLAGLLLQFLLFGFAFTTFTSGFALFAERTFRWHGQPWTPREIGYLFAYAGFLGIILQGGLIGRLVKRFGEPALVYAGFLSMGAGFILLGFTDQVPPLIGVATLVAFGHGVLRPTLTSLISQSADASEQGVVLGLTQSLTSVSLVIAPPLGGWLIGLGHLSTWAFVAALASALGWLAAGWGSSRALVLTSPPPATTE